MDRKIEITEADFAQAQATIDFIRENLGAQKEAGTLSDYCHNLLLAVQQNSINSRLAGITASAIPFYLREIGKLEEQKKAALAPSTHMGTVGEKMDFYATLLSVYPHESDFGCTFICKMVTEAGQILTWFASNDPTSKDPKAEGYLCQGVLRKLTGRVKKHDYYKNQAQTVVTRCTVWTAEGIKLAEEKAAKKKAREEKKALKAAKPSPS